MADAPNKYLNPRQLLLETPLYEKLVEMTAQQIQTLALKSWKIDGYCPHCRRETTFDKTGPIVHGNIAEGALLSMNRLADLTLECARSSNHKVYFNLHFEEASIHKVGQTPSFADIAIDESKEYSKLLDKLDTAEFHKAIGLAAHGVGIGSYVYLRRIFERLISKRFAEYKDVEGWDEEVFKKLRMKEKIEHLKNHLPEFLVTNAKLYSILSLGVHELDEKDCLAFFPVLKQSTIWILEQDKKKQEELAQRKQLEQAIAQFTKPDSSFGDLTLANLMATMPDKEKPG
jgi:hypothetical protein